MTRKEIKQKAKEQLGNQIFSSKWLIGLVVLLLVETIDAIATSITFGIASLIIMGPLNFGIIYVFLKQARDNEEMNIADIFKGFTTNFGDNFLISLMTSIYIFLWTLLFIIPGIIKTFSYSMSFYVKVDHPEYDYSQCITESRKLMKGHKWELFVLRLSFIGWYIVGILCLGIGVLWVNTYQQAAEAQFYNAICERPAKTGTEPEQNDAAGATFKTDN